jgi:hypothetical protein
MAEYTKTLYVYHPPEAEDEVKFRLDCRAIPARRLLTTCCNGVRRVTAEENCTQRVPGETTDREMPTPRGHSTNLEPKGEKDTQPVENAEHRGNRRTRGGSARPD